MAEIAHTSNVENSAYANTLQLLIQAVEYTDSDRIVCKTFIVGNRAVVLAMHKKEVGGDEVMTEYVVWWYANDHTHTGYYTFDYASAVKEFSNRVQHLNSQT